MRGAIPLWTQKEMTMAEITVNIEVWCTCGSPLCHTVRDMPGAGNITVGPCVTCVELAREEGRDEGFMERADKEARDER